MKKAKSKKKFNPRDYTDLLRIKQKIPKEVVYIAEFKDKESGEKHQATIQS